MNIFLDNAVIYICLLLIFIQMLSSWVIHVININKNKYETMDRTRKIKEILNSILENIEFNYIYIDLEYHKINQLKIQQIDLFLRDSLNYYNGCGINNSYFSSSRFFGRIQKSYNKLQDMILSEKNYFDYVSTLDLSFKYNFNCTEYYMNELLQEILKYNNNKILPEYSNNKINKIKKVYEHNNLDFNKFINSRFYRCWVNSKMLLELKK